MDKFKAATNALKGMILSNGLPKELQKSVDGIINKGTAAVTTDTQTSTNTGGVEASTNTEAPSKQLSKIFAYVYGLVAVALLSLYFINSCIGIFDIATYMYRETQQSATLALNQDILYKDTTDISAIKYIKINGSKDEDYSIFTEQGINQVILILVGSTILLIGIQIAFYVGFKIHSVMKHKPFNEVLELPSKYLIVSFIACMGAFMINSVYKKRFISDSQGKLKHLHSRIHKVTVYMYSQMTSDETFLSLLNYGDQDAILKYLADVSNEFSSTCKAGIPNLTTDTQSCSLDTNSLNCDVTDDPFLKAMFTYNLYYYFESENPNVANSVLSWKQIFTLDSIQNKSVDPTLYIAYNKNTYIGNLYPNVVDKLKLVGGFKGESSSKERSIMIMLNSKMQHLNQLLSVMHDLPQGKKSLRNYMILFLITVIVFTVIIGLILKEDIQELFGKFTKLKDFKKQ